tara:strand:- start:124 stop:582 length:459 start_codon:yes stop_codon:yes gene_type:complete
MNLFNDKDGKFKRLEKVILDIEKEKHTISWAHTTIQSCLWNLEKSPNLQKFDLEMIAKDLRENLNKKEKAQAKIIDLEYALKAEMGVLNLGTQTHALLRQVEDIKKKAGINNLWKHEEDKRLNEHFKKHPEDVGTLHITENSMTFDFSNKKK